MPNGSAERDFYMSLVHLESEALEILTTLEDINSDKMAKAIAAARALADALADVAEMSGDCEATTR
jgi:hypothetical protein